MLISGPRLVSGQKKGPPTRLFQNVFQNVRHLLVLLLPRFLTSLTRFFFLIFWQIKQVVCGLLPCGTEAPSSAATASKWATPSAPSTAPKSIKWRPMKSIRYWAPATNASTWKSSTGNSNHKSHRGDLTGKNVTWQSRSRRDTYFGIPPKNVLDILVCCCDWRRGNWPLGRWFKLSAEMCRSLAVNLVR